MALVIQSGSFNCAALGQRLKPTLVDSVVDKDVLASMPVRGHVVEVNGEFESPRAGNGSRVRESDAILEDLTLVALSERNHAVGCWTATLGCWQGFSRLELRAQVRPCNARAVALFAQTGRNRFQAVLFTPSGNVDFEILASVNCHSLMRQHMLHISRSLDSCRSTIG